MQINEHLNLSNSNFIERSSQDVIVAHLFIVYLLFHQINRYYLFLLEYLSVGRKLELIKAFKRYAAAMKIADPSEEDNADEESGSGKLISFLY